MKVLIVDDNSSKAGGVVYILNNFGVTDCTIENSVNGAIKRCRKEKFDLLVADLGLPRRPDDYVEDSKEGLRMLYDLALHDIMIPTIINSSTDVTDDEIDALEKAGFPFIGHAKKDTDLYYLIKGSVDAFENKTKERPYV